MGRFDLKNRDRETEFKAFTAKQITQTCEQEIGEQLKKIKEFEKKFKDEMQFDLDSMHNLTIIFRTTEEKFAFCEKYGILLEYNEYCFADEFIKKLNR